MKKVVIVGTSHISPESIRKAKETIIEENPDCVALELCQSRYQALLSNEEQTVKRDNPFFIFLHFLQKHFGKKTGVLPGSEMVMAARTAKKIGCKVALIDKRIENISKEMNQIPLREKTRLILDLLYGFTLGRFYNNQKFDIKSVPSDKIIESVIKMLKKNYPSFHKILVDDRNEHMARNVKKLLSMYDKIVVVVGIGHKKELVKKVKEYVASYKNERKD